MKKKIKVPMSEPVNKNPASSSTKTNSSSTKIYQNSQASSPTMSNSEIEIARKAKRKGKHATINKANQPITSSSKKINN